MSTIELIKSGQKSISTSALKEAKKSTRDLIYYYEKPKEKKSHFDFGNACELYIIDKPEFFRQVAIMDETKRPVPDKNYQTAVNKAWKDKFYEDNADKYIIAATGPESFEVICYLEQLAMKHPAYDMLFGKDMEYQKPFEWICPITGFKRYSRTDLFSVEKKYIIDIKTDGDNDFEKSARNNDHFFQAFDQIEGALHSGTMPVVEKYFWFVFGKKAPYFVDVYELDIENLLKIEEVYNSTLHKIKRDLQSEEEIVWHDAPVITLKVPNYYK